jgi:uncharacterized protein (DUF1697 family)
MQKHIAFLRAINVGGHNLKMDQLRRLFESLGLSNVETFIASGNAIFESEADPASLKARIESLLLNELGYPVATFLRTPTELQAIAAYAPLPASRLEQAVAFNVGFCHEEPAAEARRRFLALKTQDDELFLHGRELYWVSALKQSESSLSNAKFEKALGQPCTLRGLQTLLKLVERFG